MASDGNILDGDGHDAPTLTRRRFLAGAAAVVAGAAGFGAAVPGVRAATGRGRKRVVVLGGGLAGLCAAYELRNRGYRIVALLEAQGRTGGRVQTVRKGFLNGQYVELGATRIPSSHHHTLAYIDLFGLTKREFSDGDALYYLKGKPPFVHRDGTQWPADVLPGLPGEDATLGVDAIARKYDRAGVIGDPANPGYLGDPRTAAWPFDNANAAALIPKSYRQYWADSGGSDDGFVLNRAANGSDIYSYGALSWLAMDIVDAAWARTWAIAGGSDRLPAAFTSALGDVVKCGCRVTGIVHGPRGGSVTFVHRGRASSVEADLIVCTLPFSVLRDIRISPKLPDDKVATISDMRYMPVSRNFLQTRSRFWTARGIGGLVIARTDSGIDRLWHNTDVQDGATGILNAYMQNQTAIDYAASGSTSAARTAYVKDLVRQFFPEIDQEYIGGIEKDWTRDPYVKGAWGYLGAGEEWMLPVSKRPEGILHFCGEHTSAWSGWMQGALASAHRVVAEITS